MKDSSDKMRYEKLRNDLDRKLRILDCSIGVLKKCLRDKGEYPDPTLIRVDSYVDALSTCFKYLDQIDYAISMDDLESGDDIHLFAHKIRSIVELIREDVRDLTITLETGFDEVIDPMRWN